MALINRGKVWIAGDILTASDLNNEFNVIHNLVNGSIDSTNITTLTGLTFNNSTAGTNVIDITKVNSGDVLVIND